MEWIDARYPLTKSWKNHFSEYYVPKNFNFWYYFGSLAVFLLMLQIVTGIWLTMYYTPTANEALDSVELTMRYVPYGWLLRYCHVVGASGFFVVVLLHIFRGLMYGSYKKPRELVWLVGVFIYILLIVESFMGYLLPWGQMSYWGAKVITSLFETIPVYGEKIVEWMRGDFTISGITLHRFYALHVIGIPLIIVIAVFMHIVFLHEVGSNNPDGIEIRDKKDPKGFPIDGVPLYPYYVVKDIFALAVFLLVFCAIVFYKPDFWGYFLEVANFQPANPLMTPEHIVPPWYMTPFYAILRAIPYKLGGVMAMFLSMGLLFFVPWLDRSPIKSIRYRSKIVKFALGIFVVSFIGLSYLGMRPLTKSTLLAAQIFTVLYFAYFLLMPIYTRFEGVKSLPDRIYKEIVG